MLRGSYRSYSSLPKRNGSFQVRRVRIVRPFFTSKRFRATSFWLLAIGLCMRQLGSFLEEEDEEEDKARPRQVKEVVQHVKKAAQGSKVGADGGETSDIEPVERHHTTEQVTGEDDEDIVPDELPDDALFIPVGWPRQRPQTYYKGTDPEWQSFVEFARDQKRVKRCKGSYVRDVGLTLELTVVAEVAGTLSMALSKDRQMQQALGTPIRISAVWLNIDYPYGPPPEYERSG